MYYLGLDMGSTATKAVIIDKNRIIIGKGITHTGAEVGMAADRSIAEAETDARVNYFIELMCTYGYSNLSDKLRLLFYGNRVLEKFDVLQQMCRADMGNKTLDGLRERIYQERPCSLQRFIDDTVLEIGAKTVLRKAHRSLEKEVFKGDFERCMASALRMVPLDDGMRKQLLDVGLGKDFPIKNKIGTGYGRLSLPFKKEQIITEISCHGKGACYLFSGTRTVLDIGGQDTKGIKVNAEGTVCNFVMNDKCAAGTGKYLQNIARGMRLNIDEIGPLSLKAKNDVRISNTCTVFAEGDAKHLLNDGVCIEDILRAMHVAIAKRSIGLLGRIGIENELTFTGGVAKNIGVVKIIEEEVAGMGARLNVCADSQYTGAIGAALYAIDKDGKG